MKLTIYMDDKILEPLIQKSLDNPNSPSVQDQLKTLVKLGQQAQAELEQKNYVVSMTKNDLARWNYAKILAGPPDEDKV